MGGDHEHQLQPGHCRPGLLHRLPAGGKLAGALALVLAVVVLPRGQWLGAALLALVVVGLAVSSRLPKWYLLKRLLVLEPLVLGVAGLMLFQPDGLERCAFAITKANLCLLTTVLLAATTLPTDLLRVLQRLHMPWLFMTTLTLMHRYIFVLAEETERMRRARASRTFTVRRHFRWHALASVAGQLFVRASARAERIYDAMCARGWK